MGRYAGDEEEQEKSAGPWYTVRAPVSQQIGKVTTKKIQCGVCEVSILLASREHEFCGYHNCCLRLSRWLSLPVGPLNCWGVRVMGLVIV